MSHDVFISYSTKDKPIADAVCAKLEAEQIRCWIAPRDVLPGLVYGAALVDAIYDSRLMVLVFSSRANESPQVMREVERAVSKSIPIIPLRIEDAPLSRAMEFFISTPHWLDAMTPPLERHLTRLAKTVRLLLSRSDKKRDADEPELADPHAYHARGIAHHRRGDYERAIADYTEAIAHDATVASVFHDRGVAYYRSGDYDRAVADYTEALRLDPGHAWTYHDRGVVHFRKGDYERAISDYAEAIRCDPTIAAAFHDRGVAYYKLGERDRAIADYGQAIAIDPKMAWAYHDRGLAYADKGDFDRAIADYMEAERLDPSLTSARVNRDEAQRRRAEVAGSVALVHPPTAEGNDVATAVNQAVNSVRLDFHPLGGIANDDSERVWRQLRESFRSSIPEVVTELCEFVNRQHEENTRWTGIRLLSHALRGPDGKQQVSRVFRALEEPMKSGGKVAALAAKVVCDAPVPPDDKLGCLLAALRSAHPDTTYGILVYLPAIVLPPHRERVAEAILDVLIAMKSEHAMKTAADALKQLGCQSSVIPRLREDLSLASPGKAVTLAQILLAWGDQGCGPAIRAAIDNGRYGTDQKIANLIRPLYQAEGSGCAAYVADVLESAPRGLQKVIIEKGLTDVPDALVREAVSRVAEATGDGEVKAAAMRFMGRG